MAMRRIATSMISKSPLRLSSSSSKSTLGIASPLINRQSRSSSVPCLQLDEKPLTQGITTSEELEKRIHSMKELTNTARLCIQDCIEVENPDSEKEELTSDLEDAKVAVNLASIAYSELLEELALTDEGVEVLNDVRKLYSPDIDELREALKDIEKSSKEDEDE